MNCPNEIADVLLRILQTGIPSARAAVWSDDAGKCVLEADHVHNLPALLRQYKPELLAFYRNTERPSYILHM